jgi:hypothetical protein
VLNGVAAMPNLVAVRPVDFRPTPYDWVPLAVLVLLIVIFVAVYSRGDRSRGPAAHRFGRTVRRGSRVPGRGGNHRHREASRRRPNRR